MNNGFKVGQTYYPRQPLHPINQKGVTDTKKTSSFASILEQQVKNGVGASERLQFSQHAQQRLSMRGIELTEQDMEKMSAAVEKAKAKGARESLILMNDVAFVVSVKNKTVITAVDGQNMKENIFTNIDSAVVL